MGYRDNGRLIGTTLNYSIPTNTAADYYTILGPSVAAIQFVGGTTLAVVGGTTNVSVPLTSLTGGIGSAPQFGDLIIVAVERCGTTNKTYNIAGFTQIADLYQNDTEDSNFHVGYALATPIPQTSVVITGGSGAAADGMAIAVQVFRNVNQTTPLDVTSTTAGAINGGAVNPIAITPVTSGAVLVVTGGAAQDATSFSFSASYLTNFVTPSTNSLTSTNDACVGMGYVSWPGGTYDPAAWTVTSSGGTAANWSWNAVTIAIRPGPTVTLGNKRNSGIWDIQDIAAAVGTDVQGQQEYTTAGTFNFTVPAGVTSLSAVCIGGGGGGGGWGNAADESAGGGGGGSLAYNTFAVTPGEILTINVGAAGTAGATQNNGGNGGTSSVQRSGTNLVAAGGGTGGRGGDAGGQAGGAGGTVITGGGFSGGRGGNNSLVTGAPSAGGGGAGGFSGVGGRGGDFASRNGLAGTGGAGGGGAALMGTTAEPDATFGTGHGGGGGNGLYTNGISGTAGIASSLFFRVDTIASATYNNVSSVNVTGSGTGATFNVTQNANNNGYTVTIVNGGTGYSSTAGANSIRIPGTSVGGATTANDINLTINAVSNGAILSFTIPTAGTAGNSSAGNSVATLTVLRGDSTGGIGGTYTVTNTTPNIRITNVSGGTTVSGTWSFEVSASGSTYSVAVINGGTGWGVGDTLFIPFNAIGGAQQSGGGGSGGSGGSAIGGLYGGGGRSAVGTGGPGQAGGRGAVRLVWGRNFQYPNNAPSVIDSTTILRGVRRLRSLA